MGNETTLGVKLTADGGVAVGTVRVTREELEKLDATQQRMSSNSGKLASQYSGMDKMFISTRDNIRGNTAEYKRLDDQLGALLTKLDPLYARTKQLDSGNDLLTRGLREGLLTQKQYNDGLAKLTASYGDAAEGADKSAFSTVGAKRELMVLGHEAMTGNFSRMPGSFLVLAERMHMTEAIFNPLTIGITGAGIAVLVMAKAFLDGEHEVERMNNALEITNNFAGQTRGSMVQLAQSITASGTVTIGAAKDIVTELVSSGRLGAQAIGEIANLASNYARATGQDIDKIAPQLVKLFDDPSKGAAELNKQMHFLTTVDQEYIDHLVRIGQEEQARVVLAQKLNEHIPKQSENIGLLEKAWNGLAGAASAAWDAMLGIGRADTLEEKIKSLQAQLIEAAQSSNVIRTQFLAGQLAALQNQKTGLDATAKSEGEAAAAAEQRAKAYDEIKKSQTYQLTALRDELALVKSFKPSNADEASNQARRIVEINRQIRDMQAGLGKDPAQQAIEAALVQYRSALADAAKSADKVIFDSHNQALDNQLKLSLISYGDYFTQKRAIEDDYYAKQISRVQEKIKNEQTAANQARGRGDTVGAIGKDTTVLKLEGELAGMQLQQSNSIDKITQDAGAANDQIARQILGIQSQVLTASEQYGQAAVINAALQYGDLIKRLQVEGNTAGADLIQRLINVSVAKGQIQQIETSYDRMLTNLDDELKRIDIEKNAGILTEFQARQKIISISQEQLAIKLQELAAEREIRDGTLDPAAQDVANKKIQALQLQIAQLQATVSETNRTFESGAQNAVDEYFDNITNGANRARDVIGGAFKSAEDVLTNFFKTGKLNAASFFDFLATASAKYAAQQLLKPLAESGGDGIAGFFGSLFASANGNAFTRSGVTPFANGGAFGDGQILTGPTYFKFANGGSFGNGVAGEAGPEAALPLKRLSNGKLGVHTDGGAGGQNNVEININIDAGGQTQTSASSNAGVMEQLAKEIGGLVDQKLMKEMRPGGKLAAY